MIPDFSIVPIQAADRAWLRQFWIEHWGAAEMVSRGKVHRVDDLPGFVALGSCAEGLLRPAPTGNESAAQPGARVCGVATYCIENEQCELLSIDSLAEGQGIGSALLDAVRQAAASACCRRLWLITTNDNLPALRFYQRRGLRLVAVHAGAVDQSRRIKPSIPETGLDGIPLRDEIELEFLLPAVWQCRCIARHR